MYPMAGESRELNDIIGNINRCPEGEAQSQRLPLCLSQRPNLGQNAQPLLLPGRGRELRRGVQHLRNSPSLFHPPRCCPPRPPKKTAGRSSRLTSKSLRSKLTSRFHRKKSASKFTRKPAKTRWNLVWSERANTGKIEIPWLEERIPLEQIYAGLNIPEVSEENS